MKIPLKTGCLPRFLGNILKCRLCVEFCLPECREKPKIKYSECKFSNFKIIQMPVIFIDLSVLFFTAELYASKPYRW